MPTDRLKPLLIFLCAVAGALPASTLAREPEPGPGLDVMSRLIERHPGDAQLHLAYARLAAHVKEWPRALEQVEQTLAIEPDLSPALILRAEALAEGLDEPQDIEATGVQRIVESDDGSMDPVLMQIFVKEVREHLKAIRGFVGDNTDAGPPIAVTEALHRACHTLFGSARMANCEPAIALTGTVDKKIRHAFESTIGLTPGSVSAISQFADAMESLCGALEEERAPVVDAGLVARLETLELADQAAADTDTGEAQDLDSTGVEPDGLMQLASDPEPETMLEPEWDSASELTLEPEPEPEYEAALSADYDPEIAAIFCEEASELLEQAESELQALRQSPGAEAPLAELKRVMHTLKGGARLAGIIAMGDLSHALETMMPRLTAAAAGNDDQALALAQQGIDRLHQMRDAVDAGQPVASARALIAEFEQVGKAPADVEPAADAEAGDVEAVDVEAGDTEAADVEAADVGLDDTAHSLVSPGEPSAEQIAGDTESGTQEAYADDAEPASDAQAASNAQAGIEHEAEAEAEAEADVSEAPARQHDA